MIIAIIPTLMYLPASGGGVLSPFDELYKLTKFNSGGINSLATNTRILSFYAEFAMPLHIIYTAAYFGTVVFSLLYGPNFLFIS